MTKIRTTPKMIVLTYTDYQTAVSANETRYGPADVYFAHADFDRAAKHYGWGDNRTPTEIVKHMGDDVPLIEVLADSINPIRVRYL